MHFCSLSMVLLCSFVPMREFIKTVGAADTNPQNIMLRRQDDRQNVLGLPTLPPNGPPKLAWKSRGTQWNKPRKPLTDNSNLPNNGPLLDRLEKTEELNQAEEQANLDLVEGLNLMAEKNQTIDEIVDEVMNNTAT